MSDIFALAGVFSALVLLLFVTKFFIKKYALSAELSRKGVHILMGLTVALFPFVFEYTLSVWILAIFSLALFYTIRHVKKAKEQLGDALYRIERSSLGEVYFTLGVATTFTFAQTPTHYIIAIMILTFSDSFASLIGIKYGKSFMSYMGNKKSVEGSLAFFGITFIIVFIATSSPFIAINIALILTLVEAMSIKGIDNLLIPLFAVILLPDYEGATLNQNLISIALFWFALRILFKRYHTFKVRIKDDTYKILHKCKVVASAKMFSENIFGELQAQSALHLEQLLKTLQKYHPHLMGPINNDTWHSYRIVTQSDGSESFLFEPNNELYYQEVFEKCGFKVIEEYYSSKTPLHTAQDERVTRVKERIKEHGVNFRAINLNDFENELRLMHKLSLEAFKYNPYFSAIDEKSFLELYLPLKEKILPEFVQMVFLQDEFIGFMFSYIDGKNLIIKTTAFKPLKASAGTTLVLLDELANYALKYGCDTMIYALMHKDNHSAKTAAKNATIFREYALLEWQKEREV